MDRQAAIEGWHQAELATKDLGEELHKSTPDAAVIENCLMRGAMVDRISHEPNILDDWTWQVCLVDAHLPASMVALIKAHPDVEKIWNMLLEALTRANAEMVNAAFDAMEKTPSTDHLHYYLAKAMDHDNLVMARRILVMDPAVLTHEGHESLGEHVASISMFQLLDGQGYIWKQSDIIASVGACVAPKNTNQPVHMQSDVFKAMVERQIVDIHTAEFRQKAWGALLGPQNHPSSQGTASTLAMAEAILAQGIDHPPLGKTNLIGAWALIKTGISTDKALAFLWSNDKPKTSFWDSLTASDTEIDRDYFDAGYRIVNDLETYGIEVDELIRATDPNEKWGVIFWACGGCELLLEHTGYQPLVSPKHRALREQRALDKQTPHNEQTRDTRRL
jgi:hypothetical protein